MGKFVLTGASGGGKSTLLAALGKQGLQIHPEIGRLIVREQMQMKGDALPWDNQTAFRDLLFHRSIKAYDSCTDGPDSHCFFDRSFVEALAYSRLMGIPVPQSMQNEIDKRVFCNPVFVCPPWPEIFVTDSERKHDFKHALRDFEATISAYKTLGYHLVEIPKLTIGKRIEFVLNSLKTANCP